MATKETRTTGDGGGGRAEDGLPVDVPQGSTVEIPPGASRVQIIRLPPVTEPRDTVREEVAELRRIVDAQRARHYPAAPVAPADPADLEQCRVVAPPVLTWLFVEAMEKARALGLEVPPPARWRLVWHDAPPFRLQDGLTVRRASDGFITLHLNANMPPQSFLRVVYHELAHLADYHRFGGSLSNQELERRAERFAARALELPPEPEPEADLVVHGPQRRRWHG